MMAFVNGKLDPCINAYKWHKERIGFYGFVYVMKFHKNKFISWFFGKIDHYRYKKIMNRHKK
jgi:hypothetical protein